jgi:predicted amidophosphoribosyltransferase
VSPTTARKIWKNRFPATTDLIDKLCDTYHLELHEVIRRKTPEEIERIQKENKRKK